MSLLVLVTLLYSYAGAFAESSPPINVADRMKEATEKGAVASASANDASLSRTRIQRASRRAKSARAEIRRSGSSKSIFEEAMQVPAPELQTQLIFEEEETFGKISSDELKPQTVTFSKDDVQKYQAALKSIEQYRNEVHTKCLGPSSQRFVDAIDSYARGLCSFHRRGLVRAGDISENNDALVLIVNRNVLVDAPVLISRYLKFKRQRFQTSLNKFIDGDKALIKHMADVASFYKTTIHDSDWDRPYALRDTHVERVSLWPREAIFEATNLLGDVRESACIARYEQEDEN